MKKQMVLGSLILLVACSGIERSDDSYPKTREELQSERIGKLTGDGIVLFGGQRKKTSDSVGVNSHLWRATLDTIYFMPLASADPFGGIIITDWYEISQNTKERYKLNIYVIGSELRSDAIRVMVFKQRLGPNQVWQDVPAGSEMIQEIEDKILLRAREIKYSDER